MLLILLTTTFLSCTVNKDNSKEIHDLYCYRVGDQCLVIEDLMVEKIHSDTLVKVFVPKNYYDIHIHADSIIEYYENPYLHWRKEFVRDSVESFVYSKSQSARRSYRNSSIYKADNSNVDRQKLELYSKLYAYTVEDYSFINRYCQFGDSILLSNINMTGETPLQKAEEVFQVIQLDVIGEPQIAPVWFELKAGDYITQKEYRDIICTEDITNSRDFNYAKNWQVIVLRYVKRTTSLDYSKEGSWIIRSADLAIQENSCTKEL